MGASKLGLGWWWWGVVLYMWWQEKDGSKDQRGRTESCADGAVIMTIQVSCQSVRPE